MCLGVPAKVVSLIGDRALVDYFGSHWAVSLVELPEPAAVGDYVLCCDGKALRKISNQDIAEVIGHYEVLFGEAGEDPILRDLVEEVELAGNFEADEK